MIHNAAPPPARCPVPGRVEERASRPKQVRHNHRMSSRTHVSNAIPAQAEEVVNEACPRSRRSCRPKKLVDRLRCPSEQRVLCGGGRPAFPAQSSTRQHRAVPSTWMCSCKPLSSLANTRPRRLPSSTSTPKAPERVCVGGMFSGTVVELMSRRPVSHWSVTAYPLIAHLSSRALQLRSCKRHRAAARAGATSAHARCRSVLFS